jgi:hypothetical protein
MKSILFAGLLALVSSSAFAADATAATAPAKKPLSAQQQKMKDCNADAKTKALKGAERKTFMKTCLSGGADAAASAAAPAAAAPSPRAAQQEKMKSCNADAKTKGLKGAERKTFMSTCLKG